MAERASSARDDVLICGDRENLTLANITAAGAFLGPSNGPRKPVLGDERRDRGPGRPGSGGRFGLPQEVRHEPGARHSLVFRSQNSVNGHALYPTMGVN